MKIISRFLFILSCVIASVLLLAACSTAPSEERNLLKMYGQQTVRVDGSLTSVFPISYMEASHPEIATVDVEKMAIFVVTLAQKGENKSLFVAPMSTYKEINLSEYQILDTRYFKVAQQEAGTMLYLTNTSAAEEGALPIFYRQ